MTRRRVVIGVGLLLLGPAFVLTATAIGPASSDASGILLTLGIFLVRPAGVVGGWAVLRGFINVDDRRTVVRYVVWVILVALYLISVAVAASLGVSGPAAWMVAGIPLAILPLAVKSWVW